MMRTMVGLLALGGAAASYMLWRRNHMASQFADVEPETYSGISAGWDGERAQPGMGSNDDAHRPAEAGIERVHGQRW